MKVTSSISPLSFTFEVNPRRPKKVLVRFHLNAKQTDTGWEYDEYKLELDNTGSVEEEVENNYNDYLVIAMTQENASAEEILQAKKKFALNRIDGKCTAAICNGYTVNKVHYYFTERAQSDWNGAMLQILNGATSVSVKVDGAWVVYTADQVKTICSVMKNIIYIMRMYNQQLETWIARETDETVLSSLHFGSKLPDDLMATFKKEATDAGVDLSKYTTLLA